MKDIRVLIADDHVLFREGLKRLLDDMEGITVTDEAETTNEAIMKAIESDVEVVLLDISMPGRGGLEALSEIKRAKPELPVLILTMHPEETYALRVIKAGASGYLTKKNAPDKIEKAIRKVVTGGKYISSTLADQLVVGLNRDFSTLQHEVLSNREFEVMKLLSQGNSLTEIGKMLSLSVNTVSTYRSRILEKMGFSNNADIVSYSIKNNLLD